VREFGAPEALVGRFALVLPLAEIAVAALLIPAATAVAGSAGALALLAMFSVAIVVSLARGRAPDCHCFGRLYSAPVGAATLLRIGLLGGVAALTLAGGLAEPDTGILDWAAGLDVTERLAVGLGLALAACVGGGSAGFHALLRSYGKVLLRVERLEAALGETGYSLDEFDERPALGLAPGTPAPPFALPSAGEAGRDVTLDALLEPRLPLLLVFTRPGCVPCEALMPDLARWQTAHGDRLSLAVLARGEPDELRVAATSHGVRTVLADSGGKLQHAYGVSGTPSAVLLARDATIESPLAAGPTAIAELVAGVLDAPGLPVGAPAPALDRLAALDGRRPSLTGGRESLLLFWNPECGFCRSMHADLLAWEAQANGSSPQLVVISSGDAERTRPERFASPVLLDPDWSAAGAFGVGGTPCAVVVDGDGRVDSELLVGAEAILGRAGAPRRLRVVERE
jgi:thiol-disulfide isomerase/thioredoxin